MYVYTRGHPITVALCNAYIVVVERTRMLARVKGVKKI